MKESDKLFEYSKCVKDIEDNFKLGVVKSKVYNNQGELKKIAKKMKEQTP